MRGLLDELLLRPSIKTEGATEGASRDASLDDVRARQHEAQEHAHAREALRAYFADWSEVAHARVSRRDHLIRIGLAERQKRKKAPAKKEGKEEPAKTE